MGCLAFKAKSSPLLKGALQKKDDFFCGERSVVERGLLQVQVNVYGFWRILS